MTSRIAIYWLVLLIAAPSAWAAKSNATRTRPTHKKAPIATAKRKVKARTAKARTAKKPVPRYKTRNPNELTDVQWDNFRKHTIETTSWPH